jgi:endo-1,4-beta-D-glucanase Y
MKCIPLLIAATAFSLFSCRAEARLDGASDSGSHPAAKAFPQHVAYAGSVINPTNATRAAMDSAVNAHYCAWKSAYVKSLDTRPVQKWIKYDSTNSTISEAMGYGMVIAAYMGDRADFDAMYYYTLAHPTIRSQCLLAWKQTLRNGRMADVEGADSATDGDLDVAYSLLLADAQWGSSGAIDYKQRALDVLHAILRYEVNQSEWILLCGDWAASTDTHTRPSDFMIDHILVFAEADAANAAKWTNIYSKINAIVNYQFDAGGSIDTGLMGDFYVKSGSSYVPVSGEWLESAHDGDFGYNSCRTPWRLAMAYIAKGEIALLAQQQKQASWIRTKTGGISTNIMAGYYVKNGINGNAYESYDDLCFTVPFAVNAMLGGSAGQAWLNVLWTSIAGEDYGATTDYYGDAIRLQAMIVVSGNWWLPTM